MWINQNVLRYGIDKSRDEAAYDVRGYFADPRIPLKEKERWAAGKGHAPDLYKKPFHDTFSKDSKWHGTVGPDGTVYEGGDWKRNKKGEEIFVKSDWQYEEEKKNWGRRPDGSLKGRGFYGALPAGKGGVATEYSIGVRRSVVDPNFNGAEEEYIDVPSMVPGLTKTELAAVVKEAGAPPEEKSDWSKSPVLRSVYEKAELNAKRRIAAGQSPFAQENESPPREQDAQIDRSQQGPYTSYPFPPSAFIIE